MAKKGLFEKLGLVERIDDEPEYDESNLSENFEEELPEANIEGVTQENLIAEIYGANGLSDMSDSIFKVEEISKSLPATMTTETKKAAVIGILGSFSLTPERLLRDASERTNILLSASQRICDENMKVIKTNKQEIENAKMLIEQCEKTIAEHEQVISSSTELIDKEIKRMDTLVEFLGGK